MTFSGPATISSLMNDDDLTRRMREIGEQPVPGAVRDQHLHRMAMVRTAPTKRFGRVAVAAAAVVGFMAGSTGLAMAGALPAPAQDVAHDVLSTINVEVPAGKEGKRGPCVSEIAKRTDISEAEKDALKDSECPKGGPPAHAGTGGPPEGERGKGRGNGAANADRHADDPCKGKPPWAGKKDLTPEAKQAMVDERNRSCGRNADGETEPAEAPEPPEAEQRSTPEQAPPAPAPDPAPEPEASEEEAPLTIEPAPEDAPVDEPQG